jgi:hypothetical protein
MIRLFLTLCKCFKYIKKNNDYELYVSYTENACIETFSCPFPTCSAKEKFNNDGSYNRTLICYTNNSVSRYDITIPMVKCSSCGHSHALLAPVIIPYSPFSFHFVISLLHDYITRKYSTINALCIEYDISISTLYRIYHRFIADRKLMLGMMESSINQALDLINLFINSSLKTMDKHLHDFYIKTHVSFLQARCKIRLNQYSQLTTSGSSP